MSAGPSSLHDAERRELRLPQAQRSVTKSGPREAHILELQRQAGNRAVAAVLGRYRWPSVQRMLSQGAAGLQRAMGRNHHYPTRPQPMSQQPAPVQRVMTIKSWQVRAGQSLGERVRTTFVRDTYSKIADALADFHRQPGLLKADVIVGLCDYWLTKNATRTSPKTEQRRAMVEDVRAEAWREAGVRRAEAGYLQAFGGQGKSPLQAPEKQTKISALGPARDLARGIATPAAASGTSQGELDRIAGGVEIIRKYGLTAAEIAAIRTYTLGDYLYINPAIGQDEEKLKENVELEKKKPAGARQFNPDVPIPKLIEEGQLQSGVMMQGMARLPKYTGILFRGERLSFDQLLDNYAQPTYEFVRLGSASKSLAKAREFAQGIGGRPPQPEQNVHVLLILNVTNGRDISKLSGVPGEGEVGLLPGAKFSIEKVTRRNSGPAGHKNAPAKAWYIVQMRQTQ